MSFLSKFEDKAAMGNIDAQRNLGTCYENGRWCKKDLDISLHYYKLAADQGDTTAQLGVGRLYFDKECYEIAHKYYTLAIKCDTFQEVNLNYIKSQIEKIEKILNTFY